MNKKVFHLGSYHQRIFQWIALAIISGMGVWTIVFAVSSRGALIPLIFVGVIGTLCVAAGVYGVCFILIFDKIVLDSNDQKIFFPSFFARKKISYMLITDISMKEISYGAVKNYICFNLKTGQRVYCRGYIGWFSKKEATKKTEKIVEVLQKEITNGD